MNKMKLLVSSVLAVTAIAAGAAAVGCKNHEHSYASGWTYDEINHWHASACGHDDEEGGIDGVAKHEFNSEKVCTVCGYKQLYGLTVKKTTTEYLLDGKQSVDIPIDDITVNLVNDDGSLGAELGANDYTLEIYRGDERVENLTGATAGTYNIWARKIDSEAVKEAFVVVYVVDEVTEFKLKSGTFEQDLGLDIISPTWNFEVKYKSGRKEEIKTTDSRISVSNFNTLKQRTNEQFTITFTETNSKGEKVTKNVNSTYTINKPDSSNVVINTYDIAAVKSTLSAADQNAGRLGINQSNFTGVNSFITVEDNATVDYRGATDGGVLEIKNVALSVTFEGVGLLELGARSTGNNDTSGLALMDEDGNYIEADLTASIGQITKDDDFNYYAVTGPAGTNKISFKITKPGKYTICTVESVSIVGDIISTASKYVRFESLSITDVRDN